MADNTQTLCNALKGEWYSIVTLIKYLATLLDRIKAQIQAIIDRIKNTIINQIINTIKSLEENISSLLGLKAIDSNKARQDFCEVLYKCEFAIEMISKTISPELYKIIFGSTPINTIDLSKYGINIQSSFNSRYELFQYVFCRLSLQGILQDITNTLINNILTFINKFTKYFDIDFWLNNTFVGRQLKLLIAEYDAIFNDMILPFLNKLDLFLGCSWAICDYKASTLNMYDSFSENYKANRDATKPVGNRWSITKEALYADLSQSFSEANSQMVTFNNTTMASINGASTVYKLAVNNTPSEVTPSSSQTLPYNSDQLNTIKANSQSRTSLMTPGLTNGQTVGRGVIQLKSPNSSEVD